MKTIIGKIWYPVTTLGYGKRLGVWFQGCNKQCKGCISPELKIYQQGTSMETHELLEYIKNEESVDGLTISGGEPFDQEKALRNLIAEFSDKYNNDIVVFTGYTLEELHAKKSVDIEWILTHIAVLIDGRYMEERGIDIGLRGSDNQVIHVFSNYERYKEIEYCERKLQCIPFKDRLWMIGIPPQ